MELWSFSPSQWQSVWWTKFALEVNIYIHQLKRWRVRNNHVLPHVLEGVRSRSRPDSQSWRTTPSQWDSVTTGCILSLLVRAIAMSALFTVSNSYAHLPGHVAIAWCHLGMTSVCIIQIQPCVWLATVQHGYDSHTHIHGSLNSKAVF